MIIIISAIITNSVSTWHFNMINFNWLQVIIIIIIIKNHYGDQVTFKLMFVFFTFVFKVFFVFSCLDNRNLNRVKLWLTEKSAVCFSLFLACLQFKFISILALFLILYSGKVSQKKINKNKEEELEWHAFVVLI